jgi:hypothetical protein
MRTTHIKDRQVGQTSPRQADLNAMWDLIENHFEEEWRVNLDGSVQLTVDNTMLERVMNDNSVLAFRLFGAVEEHDEEERKYVWLNLPEYLIGTYIIKGIYDANQRLVNGERAYSFIIG